MCNYNLIHLKISPFSNLNSCINWSSERHWSVYETYIGVTVQLYACSRKTTFINSWRQPKITKFTSRMEFVLKIGPSFLQDLWSGVFGERVSHTEGLSNSAVAYDFFFLQSNVCQQTIHHNRFVWKNYPFIFLHREVIQIVSDRNIFANCNCSTNMIDCKYLNRRPNLILKLFLTLLQITLFHPKLAAFFNGFQLWTSNCIPETLFFHSFYM